MNVLEFANVFNTVYTKIKHLHRINWDITPDFEAQSIMIRIPSIDAVYVWKYKDNVLEAHSYEEFWSDRTTHYDNYDLKLFIKIIKKIIKGKGFDLEYRC